MNIEETKLHDKLTAAIIAKSGLEQHRDYVGISKIGECPRVIYREFMAKEKIDVTIESHVWCYAGYHQEDSLAALLEFAGVLDPSSRGREIVSSISPMFKGHIDGVTLDGDLLEFKSVTADKFMTVQTKGKALYRHFAQVQLYMRYGKFKRAFIVYRNRNTYEHFILEVPYIRRVADELEQKAAEILAAIESKEIPACKCGHCK